MPSAHHCCLLHSQAAAPYIFASKRRSCAHKTKGSFYSSSPPTHSCIPCSQNTSSQKTHQRLSDWLASLSSIHRKHKKLPASKLQCYCRHKAINSNKCHINPSAVTAEPAALVDLAKSRSVSCWTADVELAVSVGGVLRALLTCWCLPRCRQPASGLLSRVCSAPSPVALCFCPDSVHTTEAHC